MNPNTQKDIREAFAVQELNGKVRRKVIKYERRLLKEEADGKNVYAYSRSEQYIDEPAGYLVVLARGDVLRVRTQRELVRLGFGGPAARIDMDTGDVYEEPQMTLLQQAEIRAQTSRFVNFVQETAESMPASKKETK